MLDNHIFQKLSPIFDARITASLKFVFENRHLYQNFKIDIPDFGKMIDTIKQTDNLNAHEASYQEYYTYILNLPWSIVDPNSRKAGFVGQPTIIQKPIEINYLTVHPPTTLKLFCAECEDIEPYNLYKVDCLIRNGGIEKYKYNESIVQIFEFEYRCQSCKKLPEIFLLRRDYLKISIHGRSPIEQYPVMKEIPSAQRKYYSDAKIAFNSGKILAALFYLRTFIEQYLRDKNNDYQSDNIEELYEKYKSSLDPDFNAKFPSLYKIYKEISEKLHSADESSEMFELAMDKIELYFRGLNLFDEIKPIV